VYETHALFSPLRCCFFLYPHLFLTTVLGGYCRSREHCSVKKKVVDSEGDGDSHVPPTPLTASRPIRVARTAHGRRSAVARLAGRFVCVRWQGVCAAVGPAGSALQPPPPSLARPRQAPAVLRWRLPRGRRPAAPALGPARVAGRVGGSDVSVSRACRLLCLQPGVYI